jgi:hypothetical protein
MKRGKDNSLYIRGSYSKFKNQWRFVFRPTIINFLKIKDISKKYLILKVLTPGMLNPLKTYFAQNCLNCVLMKPPLFPIL